MTTVILEAALNLLLSSHVNLTKRDINQSCQRVRMVGSTSMETLQPRLVYSWAGGVTKIMTNS
jgi:hypothetical protein